MGRPRLPKAKRKSRMVSVRYTPDAYEKLLTAAGGDPKKLPEVIRAKSESA